MSDSEANYWLDELQKRLATPADPEPIIDEWQRVCAERRATRAERQKQMEALAASASR